jgi:hypothetical protein
VNPSYVSREAALVAALPGAILAVLILGQTVSETLADDTPKRLKRPLPIVEAIGFAVRVTKVILGHVTVKVLLGAVLINAFEAALEDRKIAFDGVGRDPTTGILASAVIDATMAEEVVAEHLGIGGAFVRHDVGFAVDVGDDDRKHVLHIRLLDDERANRTAFTVNERQDRHFVVVGVTDLDTGLAANERLIDLDNATLAAERSKRASTHRLADAVSKEPRALVGDF